MTDSEIIAKHDVSCRHRAQLELLMCHAIVDKAIKEGYKLEIEEYRDEGEDQPKDIIDGLFNLDDAHLILKKRCVSERDGWIYLVFGNDGWDIVNDYTINLENFMIDINTLSDKLQDGEYKISI